MKHIDDGLLGKVFAFIKVSEIPEVNNPDFPVMLLSEKRTKQVYTIPAEIPNYHLVILWYG